MFVLEKPVAVLTSWKIPCAKHAKISFVPEGSTCTNRICIKVNVGVHVKGKCGPLSLSLL